MLLTTDRVLEGDCLKFLPDIPDGTVDLAFADPPFNIGYEYDVYDDRQDDSHYLAWIEQWTAELKRVLKPDGSLWIAIGDEYAAEVKWIVHRNLRLKLRSWVVWYYTFGVHCTKKFARSHAHLLYFVKDPARFTFDDSAIRVPSARQLVYADARANPAGRLPDDTWILRPQDVPNGFSPDQNTWFVSRVCGTFKERAGWHNCQMPQKLLERIVLACSKPGELVLDPFAGSGTTLAAAKATGRSYLGIELSSEYVAQIERRLATIEPGSSLVATTSQPIPTRTRRRRRSCESA